MMADDTALLSFSIGPVHSFIAQARRIADLWAGSRILSELTGVAMEAAAENGATLIFPDVDPKAVPDGIPNRFACWLPAPSDPSSVATVMEQAVSRHWRGLVSRAAEILADNGIECADPHQADDAVQAAWSSSGGPSDYGGASRESASTFAASRLFRPFKQQVELGEKCAVCGERMALPDGKPKVVDAVWKAAQQNANQAMRPFFRAKQGRLCLVCATKRLYPCIHGGIDRRSRSHAAHFDGFDQFQPDDGVPYFALVSMDGDTLGRLLLPEANLVASDVLEGYQRSVSRVLTAFAAELRSPSTTELRLGAIDLAGHEVSGRRPQLIYAGGEDVIFVCDVRDAIPLAQGIRELYRKRFEDVETEYHFPGDGPRFTISTAVVFAHVKQPAGLVLHDAERLLNEVAKREAGRDALAIRLAKRGGPPLETWFKWKTAEGPGLMANFMKICEAANTGALSSSQIYRLMADAGVLEGVLETSSEWQQWIEDRLSRRATPGVDTAQLSSSMAQLLHAGRRHSLRIARFLGGEVK